MVKKEEKKVLLRWWWKKKVGFLDLLLSVLGLIWKFWLVASKHLCKLQTVGIVDVLWFSHATRNAHLEIQQSQSWNEAEGGVPFEFQARHVAGCLVTVKNLILIFKELKFEYLTEKK